MYVCMYVCMYGGKGYLVSLKKKQDQESNGSNCPGHLHFSQRFTLQALMGFCEIPFGLMLTS